MLLVDDHLARVALSARRPDIWGDRVPTVPWTAHLRLVRALLASDTRGQLSRDASQALLAAALNPYPGLLQVLDPRPFTAQIAELRTRPGFSDFGAELIAAAVATNADLHIAERNIGRTWMDVLYNTGVTVYTYAPAELVAIEQP